MFYISDFIRAYGPEKGLEEYRKARQIWALPNRAFHQNPSHCRMGWIKQPGDLREPSAIPHVFDWECKHGFHFLDLVH